MPNRIDEVGIISPPWALLAMTAVCRLGADMSSRLPRIRRPLPAGAARTCQRGWQPLAARYSQGHGIDRAVRRRDGRSGVGLLAFSPQQRRRILVGIHRHPAARCLCSGLAEQADRVGGLTYGDGAVAVILLAFALVLLSVAAIQRPNMVGAWAGEIAD